MGKTSSPPRVRFIVYYIIPQFTNKKPTIYNTDLQNQVDNLKSRDITIMFVFEEEFNKTLNKQEKMKLRDVSIKVAFNFEQGRKLYKWLKITKESFALNFLYWPRWNLRGNRAKDGDHMIGSM